MSIQVSVIMLGVRDVARAKSFYADGLGCAIDKDYGDFVTLDLGEGSSSLALYEWNATADDAGVPPEGSGFRGVSFHYIVQSAQEVNDVMNKAAQAGGTIVKPAAAAEWGGHFGYFSDPEGHLWKVATST